jgi:hypothetical protein
MANIMIVGKKKSNMGTLHLGMGAVIQARQETVLVDLQLKRHRTGDSGEYVSTEGQLDSASVSGKLPAHYYQEVPICETCFLVYKVINDARQKAVKKIQSRKDKSLSGPLSPPPSFSSSLVTPHSRSTSPTSFNPVTFNPRSLSPGSSPLNNSSTPHNNLKRNRKNPSDTTTDQSQLAIEHPLSSDNIDSAAKALEHLTKLGRTLVILRE